MVKSKEEQTQELRSRIQTSIDKAKEEQKKELFKKRVELARVGIDRKTGARTPESIGAFENYLRILEEMKKVKEGGLTPSHFDRKLDIHELLLVSGIYWDLAKVYDHAKPSKQQIAKLSLCLEKFVIFSKKMPFETVCAETLRKYIHNNKAVNKDLFKKAYVKLRDGKCFVATELSEHLDDSVFHVLRSIRDQVLLVHPLGKRMVSAYYRLGPIVSEILRSSPQWLRKSAARLVDLIVFFIKVIVQFEKVENNTPHLKNQARERARSQLHDL
jgi:hypothetical protein